MEIVRPSSSGGLAVVTDSITTVTNATTLTFSGATVTNGGGGNAIVTIAGGGLTVGTTTIASGATTRILYDNAGVLGEYTITGTGTVVAMQTNPSFLGNIITTSGASSIKLDAVNGNGTVTLQSSNGLRVLNGAGSSWVTTSVGSLGVASTGVVGFSSSAVADAAPDTGMSRDSAGVVAFGTGGVGSAAGSIKFTNFTASGTTNRIGTAGTNDTTADTMMTASGTTKRALTLQATRANGNVDPLFRVTDATTGNSTLEMTGDGGITSLYMRATYLNFTVTQDAIIGFGSANYSSAALVTNTGIWFANSGSGASRCMTMTNDTSSIGAMLQVTGGRQRVVSDVTNNTTTFGNITGLGFNAGAGRKYTGKLTIKCINSTATEGIKFDFNGGTATMTQFWAAAGVLASGGTDTVGTNISTSLAGVINFTVLTGETVVTIEFSCLINGAGTVIPRFAENSTAVGTATVELGSFMWTEDTP